MSAKVIDLTGQKFGRLTVLSRVENKKSRARWLCECECGNQVVVAGNDLKTGRTKSCGCLSKELLRGNKRRATHDEHGTKLYIAWKNMRQRANNPNRPDYKFYGGKGIKVCAEWEDYTVFRNWACENGYQEGLTLDRIDVNKDYSPENCRWVDWYVQQNNKSNNHYITLNGETLTLSQWERRTGIDHRVILNRINFLGWSVEDALTKPVRKMKGVTA